MNEEFQLRNNGLYCSIHKSYVDIFFSLVDYRNNYFTSSDPEKIIEFYNGFENRGQLIQWMRERPKGPHTIREVEGDKDIIVVIPTADFNGKFAKECRENIFKGLHIVFVESGVGNYYFNYAHNCNVGIKKAMEYRPKWIVVSNDDMIEIDGIERLRKELNEIQDSGCTMAYVETKNKVPNIVKLALTTYKRQFIFQVWPGNTRKVLFLERKFNIKLLVGPLKFPYNWLYKYKCNIPAIGDFAIFSRDAFKNSQNLFDENFVNGGEDIDASLSIYLKKCTYIVIKYQIDSVGGATLGRKNRMLRDILNLAYLNKKIQDFELLEGIDKCRQTGSK